jgi:hypothetical protein
VTSLAKAQSIDELVAHVADLAEGLPRKSLAERYQLAREARVAREALTLCRSVEGDCARGKRALVELELEASRWAGILLDELPGEPESKGRGKGSKQSERMRIAEEAGIDRHRARRLVKLAKIPEERLFEIREAFDRKGKVLSLDAVVRAARRDGPVGSTNEWYTPEPFLRRVRELFDGEIDSDPTSCLVAQRTVRARAWWSLRDPHDEAEQAAARAAGMTSAEIEEAIESWRGLGGVRDGHLTQTPQGRVFSNPPYSDPGPTARTILEQHRAGRAQEAVILLNVATSTAIGQQLLRESKARLWVGKGEEHPRTRMAFVDGRGKAWSDNNNDQVAYYLGPNARRFELTFAGWGVVKW